MLIRNAMVDGRLTDLRLMHGRVQEMGVGLVKSLYESEMDLAGDELRPCTAQDPLPPRLRRRLTAFPQTAHIIPGTPSPLARCRAGRIIAAIDEHAAD